MKDHPEINKFQGLKYCAISSNNEVIAIKQTPEEAYTEAIIKGERAPIIVRGYVVKNDKKKKKR